MKQRSVRAPIMSIAAAVSAMGLIFGGGLPALADDTMIDQVSQPWPPSGIIFGDSAPAEIEAALEVTGWPASAVYAGDTVTVSIHVDAALLGAPSVEGALVGLAYADELLAFAQLDASGTAEVSIRPLLTGNLEFTPFFTGDSEGTYMPVVADSATVTVDEVPVETLMWLEGVDETHSTVAYGGGQLVANVLVEPFCVDEASDQATATCYATYGVPGGEVALVRDGETIADAFVPGSIDDRLFAEPGEDLSRGSTAEWVFPEFTVPSIMLGSPDSFDVTIGFQSENWFSSALEGPFSVSVEAQEPILNLIIGDEWGEDPIDVVNDTVVHLTAHFESTLTSGAPIKGTVTFFADGVPISAPLAYDDELSTIEYMWEPTESGEYVISATYLPDTLNHLAAESEELPLTVIIPPAPNPTPGDDDTEPDDTDQSDTDQGGTIPAGDQNGGSKAPAQPQPTDKLAKTGGQVTHFAGMAGALFLLVGAATMLLARRIKA